MSKTFISLEESNPDLAKEADGWDPSTYSPGSNKKMPWKCIRGHQWEAVIGSRNNGHGCPYCSGQRVIKGENDLATEFPEIAAQADGWDPAEYMSGSHKRMPWICAKGHKFQNSVGNRTRFKQDCPYCVGRAVNAGENDLQTTHPIIASEADGWDPKLVSAGSELKLSWKCPQGHKWNAIVYSRTSKKATNCPVCSGRKVISGLNDLQTTHPELAKQAHNWDPSKVSYGMGKKLEWKCNLGHVWSSKPNSRSSQGSDCLICSNKQVLPGFNDLATSNPDIAKQAMGWDPTTVTRGHNKKKKWKCQEGHIWYATVSNRASGDQGCPSCSNTGFDPNKEGFLYFLNHPKWQMYQIGITNVPDKRIASHKRLGWELVDLRGPMDGLIAHKWEQDLLRFLKSHNADLSNANIAGKFDGYSEAWSYSSFEVSSLKELMQQVSDQDWSSN